MRHMRLALMKERGWKRNRGVSHSPSSESELELESSMVSSQNLPPKRLVGTTALRPLAAWFDVDESPVDILSSWKLKN